MLRRSFLTTALLILVSVCNSAPVGAQWGDLTATFVLDGTPAPAKKLATDKEPKCTPGGKALYDEALMVNADNKGIVNIAVYLFLGPNDKVPEIHEDYKKSEKDTVELDNRGCRFVPRVVALRTTQKLAVKNSDEFGHNTNIAMFNNASQNPNLPAGTKVDFNFPKAERAAAKVACNIHPWMTGFIILRDHPYMAISDANGKVTIKNIPAGKRVFQVWHELPGYVAETKINGKDVKWDRGKVEVEIKPGMNDLGEVHVDAKFMKAKAK